MIEIFFAKALTTQAGREDQIEPMILKNLKLAIALLERRGEDEVNLKLLRDAVRIAQGAL